MLTKTILYILIFTILSALMVPLAKKIANHINALDIPDARKVHTKIMPRFGGFAVFMGFLIGVLTLLDVNKQLVGILIAGFVIFLTGMIDDIHPIKASVKMIGQIISASIAVIYGNLLISELTIFGLIIDFGFWAYPITILFIVACMNVINLIDGLDGLAGGICSIFYLSVIIICFFQKRFDLEFYLSVIMLGSTLGFLIFNFYPASIFMGDSGSLFMGFMIAIISILGFKITAFTSIIIPMSLVAIPIIDTFFAILRRLWHNKSISEPDKEHLHHQLLKMKCSQLKTVLIIYGIDILFAIASIIYTLNDNRTIFIGRIIYIVLFIATIVFVLKSNIIFDNKKDK